MDNNEFIIYNYVIIRSVVTFPKEVNILYPSLYQYIVNILTYLRVRVLWSLHFSPVTTFIILQIKKMYRNNLIKYNIFILIDIYSFVNSSRFPCVLIPYFYLLISNSLLENIFQF